MARPRSCVSCPAYKYKYLSSDSATCALQFRYSEGLHAVRPLEDCPRIKTIREMLEYANIHGIQLPQYEKKPTEQNALLDAIVRPDTQAKAMVNFLFREIIEDAHSKYNIPQDEMQEMCRKAVNRAQFLIDMRSGTGRFSEYSKHTLRELQQRFDVLQGIYGQEWDAPEWTAELDVLLSLLSGELDATE